LTMGTIPVPLLFVSLLADYLHPTWILGAAIIVGIYTLLYLARGLHALTGETQRAAACAGLVFLAGFGWLTDTLDVIPDVWVPLEGQTAEPGGALADGEAIMFGQAGRIDDLLDAVGRGLRRNPRRSFSALPASATRRCSRKKSVWRPGCSGNDMTWPREACR
jgi:hypothetical protein